MPAAKKSTTKKDEAKAKRPEFSMPEEEQIEDLVTNAPPITQVFGEDEDPDDPEFVKSPDDSASSAKFVSKSGPDKGSSLDEVLASATRSTKLVRNHDAMVDEEEVVPLKTEVEELEEEDSNLDDIVLDEEPENEALPPQKPKVITPPVKSNSGSARGMSLFTLGLVIFSLIFGASGWALYFKTKFYDPSLTPPEAQEETTPEVTGPTQAPTPTPPAKSDIKIEVLNGSGVAGAAGKVKTYLEEKGYTVTNTGNADKSSYTTTQLIVAPGFTDTAELLISDLSAEYDTASISGELEAEDAETLSARIILGKDWFSN